MPLSAESMAVIESHGARHRRVRSAAALVDSHGGGWVIVNLDPHCRS
jgi:hypothetical protein